MTRPHILGQIAELLVQRAGLVAADSDLRARNQEAALSLLDQQIWDLLKDLEVLSQWSRFSSELNSISHQSAGASWELLYDLGAARRKASGYLTFLSLCWEEEAEREEERESITSYAAEIFAAIGVALAELGLPDYSVEAILLFLGVVDTGNHYLEDLVAPQEELQLRSRGFLEAD